MNMGLFLRRGFPISITTLCLVLFSLPVAAATQNQTVCLQCHGSQTGRGGAVVKPWQESIHAENGTSCQDCHGGDPKDAVNAMNPARGFLGVPKEIEIPSFCGRCHIGIRDDYLQSAHGKALGHGGPTCVTCHGSHDVKKATLDIINEKNCSRCHTYARAAELKAAMEQTEKRIVVIEERLKVYKGEGVDTEARGKALFSARNRYHRLFHEVNTAKVKAESAQIITELDKIQRDFGNIESERQKRKITGVAAVSGSLLAALLFYLLRKTYD